VENINAVNNRAVILSLNIQCDGVLFFKLQGTESSSTATPALRYFWKKTVYERPKAMHKWGLITPTLVPENSLLVMGGWCQAVLLHGSIDHKSMTNSSVANYEWNEAFTVGDSSPCPEEMKKRADKVIEVYQKSTKRPTTDRPRTVCTCRYVVVHTSVCSETGCLPPDFIVVAADPIEQTERRKKSAIEAVSSVHRRRSTESTRHEPLVPPGAVLGSEGRVDDDVVTAADDDAWDLFSPYLWQLSKLRCKPLDSAVEMDVVTTIWNTLCRSTCFHSSKSQRILASAGTGPTLSRPSSVDWQV
jgi:hypothetical protein